MEAVLLMTIACLDFITLAIWLKEAVFADGVIVICRVAFPWLKAAVSSVESEENACP